MDVPGHRGRAGHPVPRIGGAILPSGYGLHRAHRVSGGTRYGSAGDARGSALRLRVRQLRRSVLRADGARPAVARCDHRSRHGSGAVSRAPHSLQLDGLGDRHGPSGVDYRSVRAPECRLLAVPRGVPDPLDTADEWTWPGSVDRMSLRAWHAVVGAVCAARRSQPRADRAGCCRGRERATAALGAHHRHFGTRPRDQPARVDCATNSPRSPRAVAAAAVGAS